MAKTQAGKKIVDRGTLASVDKGMAESAEINLGSFAKYVASDELLLTPQEIGNAIGYYDISLIANEMGWFEDISKAQLAKAKPIIEKQERERIIKLLDDMFEQRAFVEYHTLFDNFRQALKGE